MPIARHRPSLILLASCIVVAACGGGGVGDATPDTTPPSVIATVPADGAGDIQVDATITATFSEAMDGTSLSTSTVLLARGGTPVTGAVTHGSNAAHFTPAAPLAHSTTYTATITTGARDAAGNPLSADQSWTFTTAPPPAPPSGWSDQNIGISRNFASVDIYGVDVDLNEDGIGIATWDEAWDSSVAGTVWAAWYRGGWEAPVQLSGTSEQAVLPRVALNDAGDAVLAYEVVDVDVGILSRTIWARRWVNGAWTPAVRISAAPASDYDLYASRPRVGIDASGRALVAWDQTDVSLPRPNSILGAYFDGTSWSSPFLVSDGVTYAAWADVAVSADGSAVVAWEQATSALSGNVWARVFDGTGWGAPARIGPDDLVDYEWATRARAVMDGSGRAFVVFEENRPGGNRIGVARLDPQGPTWAAPDTLASSAASTDYLSFPSIATDGAGNAFAVWQADVAGGTEAHGAAARFDGSAGTWTTATLFEEGGDVPYAVAAMDGAANGWALYTQSSMKARRQGIDLAWQAVASLGSGFVTDAEANGSGMVIVGGHATSYSTVPFTVMARAAIYGP